MRQFDESPLWNHNGSTFQELAMPTTLTLKNIPDEVYKRLKVSAETHRRSLNSEVIVYLESALLPNRVSPSERLARARALRSTLPKVKLKARDIDAMKREGRQ
jgi:plasmid stability protein